MLIVNDSSVEMYGTPKDTSEHHDNRTDFEESVPDEEYIANAGQED